MPPYRFCLLDLDERVVEEETELCPDDEAAMRFAHVLLKDQPIVTVWCGDRFVRRVARFGSG